MVDAGDPAREIALTVVVMLEFSNNLGYLYRPPSWISSPAVAEQTNTLNLPFPRCDLEHPMRLTPHGVDTHYFSRLVTG